jgi:arylsulfatase
MYSTDNGPHMNSWPDGAMTPFRNEKNSNWEGAYRVPAMFRWPGRVKPGQVSNEMIAHHDMLPTLLAVAGDTEVKDKLLKGYKVGNITYKVHLDGDNLVPYLTGQAAKGPRESFLYINDDQQLTGLRYDNWKLIFMEQHAPGTLRVWAEPFTPLRVPKSSISGPTHTSAPTSRRTPITTGSLSTSSCWCPPRTTSASS